MSRRAALARAERLTPLLVEHRVAFCVDRNVTRSSSHLVEHRATSSTSRDVSCSSAPRTDS
jgi:hypothetical protein